MFSFFDGGKSQDMLPAENRPPMTDREIIQKEISTWMTSVRRNTMMVGHRYYVGRHDVLEKQRTVIGEGGVLTPVENLPNNRIVDNQYRKMVIQKSNYLVGKPVTVRADNEKYVEELKFYIDEKFHRVLNAVTRDALNCGIAYMMPMYNEAGDFVFKRLKPEEVIVGWKDADHTEVEYFIRVYPVVHYIGTTFEIINKVEVYDENGISFFEYHHGTLKSVEPYQQSYFNFNGFDANWERIPLIAFKYNTEEVPLITFCKSLQDAINTILSNFQNGMEEDVHNTIMVLVNYGGEDLGEFRRNLATYGAVKVESYDGVNGDVKTLQVEVNSENYKVILEILKDKLIENCMGFDAKDSRMSGTPNQMNIQSMYSDIDLDANGMETEFKASFEDVLYFIDCHLANTGVGDFFSDKADVVFNRDILINESEKIQNLQNSVGLISKETILANHPMVDDVEAEQEKMQEQEQMQMQMYTPFGGDNVDEQ